MCCCGSTDFSFYLLLFIFLYFFFIFYFVFVMQNYRIHARTNFKYLNIFASASIPTLFFNYKKYRNGLLWGLWFDLRWELEICFIGNYLSSYHSPRKMWLKIWKQSWKLLLLLAQFFFFIILEITEQMFSFILQIPFFPYLIMIFLLISMFKMVYYHYIW